jgi:hypothetical protein
MTIVQLLDNVTAIVEADHGVCRTHVGPEPAFLVSDETEIKIALHDVIETIRRLQGDCEELQLLEKLDFSSDYVVDDMDKLLDKVIKKILKESHDFASTLQ